MGLHPRLGGESAMYRAFNSGIGDRQVLKFVWDALWFSPTKVRVWCGVGGVWCGVVGGVWCGVWLLFGLEELNTLARLILGAEEAAPCTLLTGVGEAWVDG